MFECVDVKIKNLNFLEARCYFFESDKGVRCHGRVAAIFLKILKCFGFSKGVEEISCSCHKVVYLNKNSLNKWLRKNLLTQTKENTSFEELIKQAVREVQEIVPIKKDMKLYQLAQEIASNIDLRDYPWTCQKATWTITHQADQELSLREKAINFWLKKEGEWSSTNRAQYFPFFPMGCFEAGSEVVFLKDCLKPKNSDLHRFSFCCFRSFNDLVLKIARRKKKITDRLLAHHILSYSSPKALSDAIRFKPLFDQSGDFKLQADTKIGEINFPSKTWKELVVQPNEGLIFPFTLVTNYVEKEFEDHPRQLWLFRVLSEYLYETARQYLIQKGEEWLKEECARKQIALRINEDIQRTGFKMAYLLMYILLKDLLRCSGYDIIVVDKESDLFLVLDPAKSLELVK